MIELPPGVGIVLDLDDTLYSERSYHDSGFHWIADRTGLHPDGAEVAAAKMALRSDGRPLDILSEATEVPVTTLLKWHRAHPPKITLYPDAAGFLQRAEAQSVPLVLLSDGRSGTQRQKIDALGISDAFKAILISEETGLEKYVVGAFESAATHLPGVEQIAYFGDNPAKDITGPQTLDWLVFLMLDRGDNVHAQDAGVTKAQRIRSFDEVCIS